MTDDEKLVRETWHKVIIKRHGLSLVKAFFGLDSDMPTLWKAAADFTRKRLKEIEELDEEITEVRIGLHGYKGLDCHKSACAALERTINRLESALCDLRRGMKESV